MKVLFIGGSGLISTAVSKLAVEEGIELYVLNRGNSNDKLPKEVHSIIGDIYDVEGVKKALEGYSFDSVVNWINFTIDHVKRDYELLKGITKQYVFISSASAYMKPVPKYPITEDTPLGNKYWDYSDQKRVCEEYLNSVHGDDFNVTIIRPSHTYDDIKIMANVNDWGSEYHVIKRLLEGKKIVVPGDGTSLWTITHNSDFAKGFVPILGNPKTYGESYHITADFSYTWDQLTEIIAKELGVKADILHIPSEFIIKYIPHLEGPLMGDKMWSAVFDNSKIKEISPKFNATVRYEDIISKAVKEYQSNKSLQNVDPHFEQLYDELVEAYLNK
jgi:nucleoside-diphosphate-sugar epimerase